MRQVFSAPQTIDVVAMAAGLAGGGPCFRDPTRALCARYGYQTLYEIPTALQKRLRREMIGTHVAQLQENPDAVFDHSVFMWLADWMRWLWGTTSTEEWQEVLLEAAPAADLSESILHVATGRLAVYDGFRWLDERNAVQTMSLVRLLYREFGVEARVLEASS